MALVVGREFRAHRRVVIEGRYAHWQATLTN
jgi:hypothetical protein